MAHTDLWLARQHSPQDPLLIAARHLQALAAELRMEAEEGLFGVVAGTSVVAEIVLDGEPVLEDDREVCRRCRHPLYRPGRPTRFLTGFLLCLYNGLMECHRRHHLLLCLCTQLRPPHIVHRRIP